ncbi:redoxin domain-containing protein [Ruficoccus amylovorans]|uniref:thioredoxin-dependent peroxiredoxin n=1 Tax=Ruficoccus amylovorans TaxID=1804625 RepID=A0A842HD58_9BACT|nr:redoxin domain-containing protein [Ruficoccus amylovorans]MBC2594362.1 redoxin domain-containing protein [Ruficoccus amylovorans]
MIKPGDKLDTDLELQAVINGETRACKLSDLLKRRTIISIYMKNNTGGCDLQTHALAQTVEDFDQLGWDIIAVSKDTCGSHQKYAQKQGIGFALVSDPEYKIATAADALVEKSMYGRKFTGPARCALLVEADGTVLGVIEKINTKAHAEELKALIARIG